MDLGLAGKQALVCAASQGLGKAIAQSLSREGVTLFLCARSEQSLSEVAGEIKNETGNPVHYRAVDLADPDARDGLISAVNQVLPRVDILIHNGGGPKASSAEETTLADWDNGFAQMFQSIVHLNQAFLPSMKKNGWGRIVAVTSSSVIEPIPALAISNSIRSAVTSMLKTLADEVAQFNICVNCVAPGQIYTERTEERLKMVQQRNGGSREAILDEWAKAIPAGRLGTPEEYADVVCFLCSQNASYITGSTICVDGGRRRCVY